MMNKERMFPFHDIKIIIYCLLPVISSSKTHDFVRKIIGKLYQLSDALKGNVNTIVS